ncbi:TetR family transcriptional regulator [Geodermatophilus sp. DSM 44513]|uniref:TetR/AcrR family transcriptional regulator n=1 Tax=Geodermatophilus sp. DSM 44513 TaxID=1528104 RepID=UPI00128328C2|nr:TetR family transcriptional regulator C-terminal domain-containing protein [Geodermatophilus sp. DSM 44513]WNV77817.1 TetR family transcriptional regulator [Geodermatophilus sp. DSM 44513]
MAERRSPEDRREQLLDAALALIARKGFAAVTLRDVAAEVGVAHGLLRHYFPSRGALLAAAFDRAAGEELDELAGADLGDPLARLVEVCRGTDEQHYLLWVDAWAEAPRDPELAGTLVHHHRACEDHTRRVIEAGVRAGLLDVPDPAEAARALTALVDGLAVQLHALHVLDRAQHDRLAAAGAEALLGLPAGALGARATPV